MKYIGIQIYIKLLKIANGNMQNANSGIRSWLLFNKLFSQWIDMDIFILIDQQQQIISQQYWIVLRLSHPESMCTLCLSAQRFSVQPATKLPTTGFTHYQNKNISVLKFCKKPTLNIWRSKRHLPNWRPKMKNQPASLSSFPTIPLPLRKELLGQE